MRIDVTCARMQCPDCGTPVDVVGLDDAREQVILEPCTHRVPVAYYLPETHETARPGQ